MIHLTPFSIYIILFIIAVLISLIKRRKLLYVVAFFILLGGALLTFYPMIEGASFSVDDIFLAIMGLAINPFFHAILIILIAFFSIHVRNTSHKLEMYNDLETLNKDIDVNYPPSIVSLLLRNNLETKDIAADVMYLYSQKAITLTPNNKFEVNYDNLKKIDLEKSDIYLLRTIIEGVEPFEMLDWSNLVEEKYSSLNFSQPHENFSFKHMKKITIILILFFYVCFSLIGYMHDKDLFIFFYGIFFATGLGLFSIPAQIIFAEFYNSKYAKRLKLNKKGINEFKKWMNCKKFMEEYTLLEDKKVEDIIIYEKYIPYAVALGVNKNYEETIYAIFNEEEVKMYYNIFS